MGFECGFYTIPKSDVKSVKEYLYSKKKNVYDKYYSNSQYTSFKDFFEFDYSYFGKKVVCEYPDIEYKNIQETEIDFWCSSGRYIDDEFIQGVLSEIKPFEEYEVTEEFIDKSLEEVSKELSSINLKSATVTHSFRYDENGDKILSPCDGILTEDEYGNEHLLDLELENIWISDVHFDEDRYNTLNSFKDTLIKLKSIDIDKNFIIYFRSY